MNNVIRSVPLGVEIEGVGKRKPKASEHKQISDIAKELRAGWDEAKAEKDRCPECKKATREFGALLCYRCWQAKGEDREKNNT